MPEPQRRKRPPVILRAAITVDGKLDGASLRVERGGFDCPLAAAESRTLLAAGAVDELLLTVHPRIDGRRDAPTLSGPPTPEFFPRSVSCRLLHMETRDGGCLLHYRVVRRARAAAAAG